MRRKTRHLLDFITIVSFGRSGSTALQAALNAHPYTIVRGENYGAFVGLDRYVRSISEAADRHHSGSSTHPWFGTARLDPASVVSDIRRHAVDHILRPKPDTRWLGFKEVRYEVGHIEDADRLADHLLFLNLLFPGIRYVFNIRDPRKAASSGWWRDHPDAVVALETTVANLREACGIVDWVLGSGRAAWLVHDEWMANASLVTSGLAEIGFPANHARVASALTEHLGHGGNREMGGQGHG